MIDLTEGTKEYIVPTRVVRGGIAYMGPDVKVNAKDKNDAKRVASKAGHQPNEHFPVREVKSTR